MGRSLSFAQYSCICNYLSRRESLHAMTCYDDPMAISTERLPVGGRKGRPLRPPSRDHRAPVSEDFGAALSRPVSCPWPGSRSSCGCARAADGRLKMSEMANAIFHWTGGHPRLARRLEGDGLVRTRALRRRTAGPSTWRSPTRGNARLDDALNVHLEFLGRAPWASLSTWVRARHAALALGKKAQRRRARPS